MKVDMWIDDIVQLKTELPRLHRDFFYKGGRREFFSTLENLEQQAGELGAYGIVMGMARAVATIRDAHTTVVLPRHYRLPFECYPFAEGVYITGTDAEHLDLLHTRVEQIGGHPIDEVVAAITDITPHENRQFVLSCLPGSIASVDILYGLGVVEYIDSVEMSVTDRAGQTRSMTLGSLPYSDYLPARDMDTEPPLYQRNPDSFYWSHYRDGLFYVNYSRCRDMPAPAPSVEDFCRKLMDELSDGRVVEKLVIDLRHNTGGNSELFKPFLHWLAQNEALNRRGRLFVIVGRDTFSSASLNMYYLSYNTEAIFVGEPTGGKPNHFGEVRYLELKHSGLYIRYSTKYYQLIDDDEQLSFQPDICCPVRFADYANRMDRCLAEIFDFQ